MLSQTGGDFMHGQDGSKVRCLRNVHLGEDLWTDPCGLPGSASVFLDKIGRQ